MLTTYLIYLAKASTGLAAFALLYHLLLRRLTHFHWNRAYLLAALLLSLSLPLVPLPLLFSENGWPSASGNYAFLNLNFEVAGASSAFGISTPANAEHFNNPPLYLQFLGLALLAVYLLGCLFKAFQLFKNLWAIGRILRRGRKVYCDNYCLVYHPEQQVVFSFLRYIFLHAGNHHLSEEELAQMLAHEQAHADQRHSLDLLLFESATVLFWFHPAMHYLGASIRQVHEFQVDAAVTHQGNNIRKYGELLLKLAVQPSMSPLLTAFSSKQIFLRIKMLTQTKSSPMQKLRFLITIPVIALVLLLSSFLAQDKPKQAAVQKQAASLKTAAHNTVARIRKINWTGNTLYTEAELNSALGLKPGDTYRQGDLNALLNYRPDGKDIASLFMDKGYLFFTVTPKEVFNNETVDLEIILEEGPVMKIGQVRIAGNTSVDTEVLLQKINLRPGELFNRSKLIQAQGELSKIGSFNAEKIGIQPIPNIPAGTVDIEFTVEEI